MTKHDRAAHALRTACTGYPSAAIVDALADALRATVTDPLERRTLTALLAYWLAEPNDGEGPPPVDDLFVRRVKRSLHHRAH